MAFLNYQPEPDTGLPVVDPDNAPEERVNVHIGEPPPGLATDLP